MSKRSFASSVSTWLFAFLLFMFVATFGFILVFSNPATMKDIINQSGFYQSLVSGILEQIHKQSPSLVDPIDTIPLNRQEIETAIHASFPPELLQRQGETVIDALYVWLEGKSLVPNFRINLTTAKATFALAMGGYVQKRLSKLPVCSIATAPASFDAFSSACKPIGFDVTGEIQKVELEVASSNDFLPTPTLTANSFLGSNGKPLFTQLGQLPGYYQTAISLPYIFGTFVLITAAVAVFISIDKHKAARRLGGILISLGLFFIVTAWLFNSLFQHFTSSFDAQSGSGFFTQSFTLIFNQADKAFNREYLILGGLCVALGGALPFITNIFHFRFKPSSTTSFAADHPKPDRTKPNRPPYTS